MLKIYFSGGFPYFTPEELDAFYELGIKRRLFSYYFIENDAKMHDGFIHICDKYLKKGINYEIMMDSGAFSVAMSNTTIDIDKYANFLLSHKDNIEVIVGLDVVTKGRSTLNKLNEAAGEGWENLKYLENKGLKVLHTYHSGEDEKWLKKLMDNYEYFGVSKTFDVKGVEQRLDRIFSMLVDKKGRCGWKVHGFGATGIKMMTRWPFYSVDSSSWIKYGCFGMIILFRDGKMKSLGMSDRKLTLWAIKGAHYNNLNKIEREIWDNEMEKRGMNREDLQDNRKRDMWNIESFIQLEEWVSKREILFLPKRNIFNIN